MNRTASYLSNDDPSPRDEAVLLLEAFSSFAQVSSSLERTYQELQEQASNLSAELEEKNYYLDSVLQSLPCGVLVVQAAKVVTTINAPARELLKLPEAPVPASLDGLLEGHPWRRRLRRVFLSDRPPGEIRLEEPAGSLRHLAVSWSHTPRGDRVLVVQDMTEIRRLQEQMQKAERRAAMGEIALEVAHEIRNPLAGLGLFVDLLEEDDLDPEDRRRFLENMRVGIRSLETILSNMLCYSRRLHPLLRPCRLSGLIEETLSLIGPLLEQRRIQVERSFSDGDQLPVDREMMGQVFMNLLLNSLQALSEGGRLRVATRSEGTFVWASVRDDGVGIPKEFQGSVFEPHFTTNGKGSGLGLAIVRRIVEAHGGLVELTSRKGWGTEFRLRMPVESAR